MSVQHRRASVKRSTPSKVLWATWMGGGGVATATIVYLITGSLGWAAVGLLVSGPVLNIVGQTIVQPSHAVSRASGRRTGRDTDQPT